MVSRANQRRGPTGHTQTHFQGQFPVQVQHMGHRLLTQQQATAASCRSREYVQFQSHCCFNHHNKPSFSNQYKCQGHQDKCIWRSAEPRTLTHRLLPQPWGMTPHIVTWYTPVIISWQPEATHQQHGGHSICYEASFTTGSKVLLCL